MRKIGVLCSLVAQVIVLSSLTTWVPAAALLVMPMNRSAVTLINSSADTNSSFRTDVHHAAKHPWGIDALIAQGPHGGDVLCDVFFKTGKYEAQMTMRNKNVQDAMTRFPAIRKFEVLSWEDNWDMVTKLCRSLGIAVDVDALKMDYWSPAKKGMIAHWATLLMAFAFQVQFSRECMVLLEDDLELPPDFDMKLSSLRLPLPGNEILWLQSKGEGPRSWGEGFVFTLAAAKHFLMSACLKGIKKANDRFILDNFKTKKVYLNTKRLVAAGDGNIRWSDPAQPSNFTYKLEPPLSCWSKITTAVYSKEDLMGKDVFLAHVVDRRFHGRKSEAEWTHRELPSMPVPTPRPKTSIDINRILR